MAVQQNILASLSDKGRCAILWPHGVLFRNEEQTMRAKMVEQDWVEAVIGLGPNLFYNSPMEACVVICRARKAQERRGRILFINAVEQVTRERAESFLTREHIDRIASAYHRFVSDAGLASLKSLYEIRSAGHVLSVALHVAHGDQAEGVGEGAERQSKEDLAGVLSAWLDSASAVRLAIGALLAPECESAEQSRDTSKRPALDS